MAAWNFASFVQNGDGAVTGDGPAKLETSMYNEMRDPISGSASTSMVPGLCGVAHAARSRVTVTRACQHKWSRGREKGEQKRVTSVVKC